MGSFFNRHDLPFPSSDGTGTPLYAAGISAGGSIDGFHDVQSVWLGSPKANVTDGFGRNCFVIGFERHLVVDALLPKLST